MIGAHEHRRREVAVRLLPQQRQKRTPIRRRFAEFSEDPDHPLAAVEGAFNAVLLQGDSIREVILEGPGAGGAETARQTREAKAALERLKRAEK